MSGFQTLAQRKLAALKKSSAAWQSRAHERDDEEESDDEGAAAASVDEAAAGASQRKKAKHTVATDADSEVVSDASAAEQAALAAMFPSTFGAVAKPAPDPNALHTSHARKPVEPTGGVKVKIEGAPAVDEPALAAAARPKPKKVAMPAPALLSGSLLGADYGSSSDEEVDNDGANGPAAAASSAAAAAPSVAAAAAAMSDDDDDSDDENAESSQRDALLRSLPITHEAALRTNGHTKTVCALAVDRSGGRVLSGGYDYQAKLWDFGGMNDSLAAFRTFEPQEGHQVRQLAYSNSGDMFLAVTGSAQPKIYTREAVEVCQFQRGDMYLVDQKQTKGHSTPVTSGWWHPTDRNTVLTSGIDGTIRLWDINRPTANVTVIKPRGLVRGCTISATAFAPDGKMVAAACTDGSLRLFKYAKAYDYRDDKVLLSAHTKGSETSALLFSRDGFTLFSRGGANDHTLKQWDVRAFKQPIHIIGDLENAYPETDMAFSPDERVIVTGTSSRENNTQDGAAIFIDRSSMKPIQQVTFAGCRSVVRTVWHAGINQLLFGCNDGSIRLLYDPVLSNKGALMCLTRKAKPKALSEYTNSVGAILTPHALPSMRTDEARSRKRVREKTAASLAPETPLTGKVGVQGRAAGQQSITAYQLSKYVAMRPDPRAQNPREALLAYDDIARADPQFTAIYNKNQPVPIFAEVPEEERQVEMTQEEYDLANKKEGQATKRAPGTRE